MSPTNPCLKAKSPHELYIIMYTYEHKCFAQEKLDGYWCQLGFLSGFQLNKEFTYRRTGINILFLWTTHKLFP